MSSTKEKQLAIELLTEKIQRISGKKVVFEDQIKFLKKGTEVILKTSLYQIDTSVEKVKAGELLTSKEVNLFAKKGDVLIADGMGMFETESGLVTSLDKSLYKLKPIA